MARSMGYNAPQPVAVRHLLAPELRGFSHQPFDAVARRFASTGLLDASPAFFSDPFDRMLIAQSQMEDVAVVTDDKAFDSCDVRRFW